MTNIIKNRNTPPAVLGSFLDQLFPQNVTTLLNETFWGLDVPKGAPVAPVNIRETADDYELELAAPGLQKSDFHLKIEGDTLTITYAPQEDLRSETSQSGQNRDNTQPRWVRREFARQAFQRHFELGNTIDRDRISARYESGILYLSLPKKESLRPIARQIDIH